MASSLTLALNVALTLSLGCAGGIGPGEELDEEPDAGPNKRDDPEPQEMPDASIDYPCTGGSTNFVEPNTGHCYMFFASNLYWENAKTNCEQLDGYTHLVTIEDSAENDFVVSLIGNADAWMAATDEGSEGTWTWTTGESFSFENWRAGEPNNGNGNEDCAVIEGGQNGTWDDRGCTATRKYVCERSL